MAYAKTQLSAKLHVLSPIHIGCGQEYEPTEFTIPARDRVLVTFDPGAYVEALPQADRQRFFELCDRANLLELFKFIRNHLPPNLPARRIGIAPGLAAHYDRVLSLPTADPRLIFNNFNLGRTAFQPFSNLPYIPGTALKGALRTGMLSARAVARNVKDFTGRSSELEKLLLEASKSFETDPFRLIKPADFQPEAADRVATRIVYAVNLKKRPGDRASKASQGPHQIFEVIEPGSIFAGTIAFEQPPTDRVVARPIGSAELLEAVKKSYVKRFQEERDALAVLKIGIGPLMARFNQLVEANKSAQWLIVRLGRHSGAESVTIENNRQIKIEPKRDGRTGPAATTLWLASDSSQPTNPQTLTPFGWAALEVAEGC